MIQGGGKSVITTEGRFVGPGHFGRYIEEEGVEKMSFHWEADMDQSGRSVLAIRPLLWKDGWPVAGEAFHEGTYEIQSVRSGYALELEVDFVRAQGAMRGFGRGNEPQPNVVLEEQKLEEVAGTWPEGVIGARAVLTTRSSSRVLTAPLLQMTRPRSRPSRHSPALPSSSGVSTS